MNAETRNTGLDIIRTAAIIFVMITHMLNYTGLMHINLRSFQWIVYDIIHYASMLCVPLFLLLTGFLHAKRRISFRHYASILPIIVSYLSVCAITAPIILHLFGLNDSSIGAFILSIFNFQFGYSWYVEMYLSLFLVIPFLNLLADNLMQKQMTVFIALLIFSTMLPALLIGFKLPNGLTLDVFPDFFENNYVITYYMIGSYIARFNPAPSRFRCLLFSIGILGAESVVCFLLSAQQYAWEPFNKNAALTHMLAAVGLFLALYTVQLKSRFLQRLFMEISVCSFEMYLISYCTDRILFTYLTLPAWQILCINFILTFCTARLIHSFTAPFGRYVKNILLEKIKLNP